jgi:hypothetical protein
VKRALPAGAPLPCKFREAGNGAAVEAAAPVEAAPEQNGENA